jgi:hypothetical protein
MDHLLSIVGLGIVAFAIWLTVRIVNRREKWAVRVAVIAVILLAYPMSLVPACWLAEHNFLAADTVAPFYDPLFWLEFRSPKPLQGAACRWASSLRLKTAYIRLRDNPFPQSYPVSDLTFRWKDGQRVFDVHEPWLLNMISANIESESWEDFAGPGTLHLSSEDQALKVLQSRRVHAAIPSFIEMVRLLKASLARGRDVDAQQYLALRAADAGFVSEPKFRPGVVRIANPTDDQLKIEDRSFADIDELIEFLRHEPRDTLRAGICWDERRREPSLADGKRLTELCQVRDLDLFIRPNYASHFGQVIPDRRWWIVRASDTIYLDPE